MEYGMDGLSKGELSRKQVADGMLITFDETVANKKWGELHYVVDIKAGVAKQIKRYFQESLTAESFK